MTPGRRHPGFVHNLGRTRDARLEIWVNYFDVTAGLGEHLLRIGTKAYAGVMRNRDG